MCAKETEDTIVEMPTQEGTPTKSPEERLEFLEQNHANPQLIQQVVNGLAQDMQTLNLRMQVAEGCLRQLEKEQNLTGIVRERNDEILVERLLRGVRQELDRGKDDQDEKDD
jgi:hypothetical protein